MLPGTGFKAIWLIIGFLTALIAEAVLELKIEKSQMQRGANILMITGDGNNLECDQKHGHTCEREFESETRR